MTEDLGNSPVPLTEDILDKKGDYVNTFFEYITKEGIMIIEYANVTTGTTNLYTVPKNHNLYLISAHMSSYCDGGGGAGSVTPVIQLAGVYSRYILSCKFDVATKDNQETHEVYTIPIKLEEDSVLRVVGTPNTATTGVIKGYLVKKPI